MNPYILALSMFSTYHAYCIPIKWKSENLVRIYLVFVPILFLVKISFDNYTELCTLLTGPYKNQHKFRWFSYSLYMQTWAYMTYACQPFSMQYHVHLSRKMVHNSCDFGPYWSNSTSDLFKLCQWHNYKNKKQSCVMNSKNHQPHMLYPCWLCGRWI